MAALRQRTNQSRWLFGRAGGFDDHDACVMGRLRPRGVRLTLVRLWRIGTVLCKDVWGTSRPDSDRGPDRSFEPHDMLAGQFFGLARLTCRNGAQQLDMLTDVLVHGG